MLKRIVLGVVVLVALVLILASMKPATFRVERSITINATSGKIYPLIDDFHNWGQWSPWAKLDPNMKVTYSGSPLGVGAAYTWEGNSKVGAGTMDILGTTPTTITIKLDFDKPMEGHDITEFNLEPKNGGSATQVTWVMTGDNTFFSKVMSVFVSMDRMIGPDFEKGLAALKVAGEKAQQQP